MKFQNILQSAILTLCVLAAGTITSLAQGPMGMPQRGYDPLRELKRAINAAQAPALTAQQETDLTALITAYRDSLPSEDANDALDAAQAAFDKAVLAGDLAAAQTQAAVIATITARFHNNRLVALAKLEIGAIAILKTGGQYQPLVQKFGEGGTLNIIGSLADRAIGRGPGR